MIQAGDDIDLALEQARRVRARELAAEEHLERDDPAGAHLPGSVHDAHAAGAEAVEDLVRAEAQRREGAVRLPRRVGVGRRRGAVDDPPDQAPGAEAERRVALDRHLTSRAGAFVDHHGSFRLSHGAHRRPSDISPS
ncbi:hypothetical protein [Sorangium sp. So ce1182]|uniref:hypothetical protein n=1 Tax=Sorangium sp. So ce1182 TaxID=3133334 RepID=UPI003F5D570C